MADLGLKDRLQPALLDRLIDEERHVTRIRVTVRHDVLDSLRLGLKDLSGILSAQGLRREDPYDGEDSHAAGDTAELRFVSIGGELNPAQLKSRVIKPPGRPAGIALQEFCQIEAHTSLNQQLEVGEKGIISMRRLRESVQRDLGWLLNAANLDTIEDLSRYPHVARSVLNYGMPSFSGRTASSIDVIAAAQRIREAVTTFEPRLSRVQVTPEPRNRNEEVMLAFRIEAELWGQPVPQQLVLRTSIDVESGDVRITESS